MAKATKSYMVRRGRRYLIERSPEGTFLRFVPKAKAEAKRLSAKKASSIISSKPANRKSTSKSSKRRARA